MALFDKSGKQLKQIPHGYFGVMGPIDFGQMVPLQEETRGNISMICE